MKSARRRAALELRAWQQHGRFGLGELAWQAVQAAAERLGYPSVAAASHDGRSAELFSEAIEDCESDD